MPTREATPPTSCAPPAKARIAASMLRDWSRADASFQTALGIVRGSPNSSERAERAVVLMQAQSLLDRGAPAPAAEAMKAYARDGSRPSLLLEARIALIATPATSPDDPTLKARVVGAADLGRLHPGDALAWSALAQTWSRLGAPLRALRAEAESRYALGDLQGAADRLRAGQRLARSGGRRRRFHRSLGDRFAPARRRGPEKTDRGRPALLALTRARASRAATSSRKRHRGFASSSRSTLRLPATPREAG